MRKVISSLKIFILPPSIEILAERLKKRMKEGNMNSKENITKRLAVAKKEMKYQKLYDFSIENKNIEDCIEQVKGLIINYYKIKI